MAKLDLIQEEETVEGSNKKKAQPVDEPKIAALQQKHIPEDRNLTLIYRISKKRHLEFLIK